MEHKTSACHPGLKGKPHKPGFEAGDPKAARELDPDSLTEYANCLDRQNLEHQIRQVQTHGKQKGLTRSSLSGILEDAKDDLP